MSNTEKRDFFMAVGMVLLALLGLKVTRQNEDEKALSEIRAKVQNVCSVTQKGNERIYEAFTSANNRCEKQKPSITYVKVGDDWKPLQD